jgi:hypothetical protein
MEIAVAVIGVVLVGLILILTGIGLLILGGSDDVGRRY